MATGIEKRQSLALLAAAIFVFVFLVNSQVKKWIPWGTDSIFKMTTRQQPLGPNTTNQTHQPVNRSKNTYTKWIVTTTNDPKPTKLHRRLAKVKGWNLVVVGNRTTASPRVWRSANIVYMGPKEQSNLTRTLGQKLKQNVRHTKVYGYLYAIQQGASHIYDVDSHLVIHNVQFQFAPTTSCMVYDNRSRSVVNPHVHFRHPSLKARGFPLEFEASPYNDQYKVYSSFKTPAIQQGVSGQFMDVDVSRQMTTGWSGDPFFSVSPKSREPPVTVPPGMLAPFNSRNTLYSAEAFWALLLPNSAPGTMADIWRSYWSQPLLWLTGNNLAFWPTNTSFPKVNVTNNNPYDEMKDELEFYRMAKGFVNFLVNWTCEDKSFFKCVQKLTSDLAKKGYCDQGEVQVTTWWIDSLKALHYKEPKITFKTSTRSYEKFFQGSEFRQVFLYHNRSQSSTPRPAASNIQVTNEGVLSLHHICGPHLNLTLDHTYSRTRTTRPNSTYPDVLMIIVFNYPYLELVGFLDHLYRDHFPNRIYCTNTDYENVEAKLRGGWSLPWSGGQHLRATILSVNMSRGIQGYECAIGAIEMKYKVDGYLIVADDILFNYWNLRDYISRSIPLTSARLLRIQNRHVNRTKPDWSWWTSKTGMVPTNAAFDDLLKWSTNKSDPRFRLANTFFNNLKAKGLNDSVVWFNVTDIYYIPTKYSEFFTVVIKAFAKYKTFMEIAIPTTFMGLTPFPLNVTFHGSTIWLSARNNPFKYFNATQDFVHPVKLSGVLKNSDIIIQYCQHYVREVINHW